MTSSAMERTTFHLLVEDQPGVIESVSSVFSGRGVSMDAVLAHRSINGAGEAVAEIAVTVRAAPARARMLERALGRLRFVQRVVAVGEDSPRLGEVAVVEIVPGSGVPFFEEVACFPVDAPAGAPRRLLLYGRPARVLEAIERLRAAGAVGTARFTRFLLDGGEPPDGRPTHGAR